MPTEIQLLRRRAEAQQRAGQLEAAASTYRQLLAGSPESPDDWFNLGWLLRQLGQAEPALAAYGQALAHGLSGAEEAHLNRASLYSEQLRRDDLARLELERALALAPDYAPAWLNLGNLEEEAGARDAAIAAYGRLLSLPSPPADLALLARARLVHLSPPSGPDDPLLATLAKAAQDPGIAPADRATGWFALGRACDALGQVDRAFPAFALANQLAAATAPPYDFQAAARQTELIQSVFCRPRSGPAAGDGSRPPLFICGMFRSGSTLLEQVLGAHPDVQAGGEIEFLPRLVRGRLAPFPQAASALSETQLRQLAHDYRAELARQYPQAAAEDRLLTDKRPDNWRLIGLVKQLFPDARFVHTVRDPRDVGLSIWMHHLDPRQLPHACDLAAIGHHYGQYLKLMGHWRELYPDAIRDFDYDAFVQAPRENLEPLLAWLGLDWNDACLDFHRQTGSVRTASYWQVRRPLYGDASGRWRRYGDRLQPLLAALDRAGVRFSDP